MAAAEFESLEELAESSGGTLTFVSAPVADLVAVTPAVAVHDTPVKPRAVYTAAAMLASRAAAPPLQWPLYTVPIDPVHL